MGKQLVWGTVLQGNSLGNVILCPKSLHTGRRVYEVSEPTHLRKLR